MNKRSCVAAAMLSVLLGCSHEHEPEASHAEEAGIAITHFTAHTELFVEFPRLVLNEKAEFVAHLTRLSDYKPAAEGKLVVTLSGGGQADERAEAGVSATPGIFKPSLTPRGAGKRRLTFALTNPPIVHDAGEVEVFADKKAAAAAGAAETDSGIRYTKEQQWKSDFAVEPAAARAIRESVAVTATLRPRSAGETRITAPGAGVLRPAGELPQIGTRVKAGQVLGFLLPRLGGENDAATLQLAASRARMEADLARQERARLETLHEQEAVAEKRVIEARHRERVAQAELAAAERRAAAYRGAPGGIPLKSPIAGTVVGVHGAPGAAFESGQAVFHVADLSRLWLEAQVPEAELARIREPAGAFFRPGGHEDTLVLEAGRNARLVAFGGLVHPDTRTVPAILEFENPDGRLKAGMQFRAGLYTGRVAQGIAVPASALVDDAGQTVLFVQKEGERFERRVVAPGPRDGDWVAIPSGVAPGERIVTRGAWQVRLAASAPASAGHGHTH